MVDVEAGINLGFKGGSGMDMELAGSMLCDMVTAHQSAKWYSDIDDDTQEIIVTLGRQVHMLRPVETKSGVYVHLVLDKARSNIGAVRIELERLDAAKAL